MSIASFSAAVGKLKALPAKDKRKLRSLLYGAGGIGVSMIALASYVRYLNTRIQRNSEKNMKQFNKFGIKVKEKVKVQIGMKFVKDLRKLLGICIPSWRSQETLLLILQLVVLYMRTMASIQVAKLDGRIVQAITSRKFGAFVQGIGYWMMLSLPAGFINAMIRYLTGRLRNCFRGRLVEHCQKKYLAGSVFYKVCNLDSRLKNCDQLITADILKFCTKISKLYTDISKPFMDLFLYSWQLYYSIGLTGPATLISFYFVVGYVLRFSSPPFGRLAAEEGALEGNFRFCHSRLIQNCEEIAFYRGAKVEGEVLDRSFEKLKNHILSVLQLKIPYSVMENFSLKYVASVLVFTINAFPFFFGTRQNISEIMGEYMVARKLLLDLCGAIQRVMESYKEISEVSGYSGRVSNMLQVFDEVNRGEYQKETSEGARVSLAVYKDPKKRVGDHVSFEKVPIVTPNGDILVPDLSMSIKKGDHLIITGPNGCGKSSLFRIMGGLWPIYSGTLTTPKQSDMIWIPQRAYLSLGTLQEQIIYPHSVEDFERNGGTIKQLEDIMVEVNLSYVVEREGGWESLQNWKDRLSGGEKQRVGLARMFYHKPKYAILDECTSQVSVDWEGKMYQHAQDLGITLITVSHRDSLWKFHNYVVKFDGEGGVEKIVLRDERQMSLEKQKMLLEEKLGNVDEWRKKLSEIQSNLRT